jgi:hypothetical protein
MCSILLLAHRIPKPRLLEVPTRSLPDLAHRIRKDRLLALPICSVVDFHSLAMFLMRRDTLLLHISNNRDRGSRTCRRSCACRCRVTRLLLMPRIRYLLRRYPLFMPGLDRACVDAMPWVGSDCSIRVVIVGQDDDRWRWFPRMLLLRRTPDGKGKFLYLRFLVRGGREVVVGCGGVIDVHSI